MFSLHIALLQTIDHIVKLCFENNISKISLMYLKQHDLLRSTII